MRVEVNKYSISITGQSRDKDFTYGALPACGYIYIDKNGTVRASNLSNEDFQRIGAAIKQGGLLGGQRQATEIMQKYKTENCIVKIQLHSHWDTETYKDERRENNHAING